MPEPLLEVLARRDVRHRTRDPQRAPLAVANDDPAAEHPDEEPFAVAEPVLAVEVLARASRLRRDIDLELREVAQVHAAEPLFRAGRQRVVDDADHLAPALGEIDLTRDEVPVPESVVRAARRQGVPLLALPQRKLDLAPFIGFPLEPFVRVLELHGALKQAGLQFLEPSARRRLLRDARTKMCARPQHPPRRDGPRDQCGRERYQPHARAPGRAVAATLLTLDGVADVEEDFEVELLAAVGKIE